MTLERKVRQLILIGAAAAAIAAPAAGAATGGTVQIDGKLVAPTEVSTVQRSAGEPRSAQLVQIGGRLVPPSELSAVESQLGGASATDSSDGGFDWNSTGIELSLLGALVFFAGLLGVLWQRGRLSTV
jgi:hypothetical protein